MQLRQEQTELSSPLPGSSNDKTTRKRNQRRYKEIREIIVSHCALRSSAHCCHQWQENPRRSQSVCLASARKTRQRYDCMLDGGRRERGYLKLKKCTHIDTRCPLALTWVRSTLDLSKPSYWWRFASSPSSVEGPSQGRCIGNAIAYHAWISAV